MAEREYLRLDADQVGLLKHVEGAPRAILNLPIRIDLDSPIDEEMCLEAMRLTVTRLPFCKLRLHDNETVQYFDGDDPQGIEIVDLSNGTEEDVNDYILEQAGTPFENECNDCQLYNFKLIRTPGGMHTIFFCGYHIIMDSVGVIQVITYFDKVYSALKNGTELPPEGVGIEKQIETSWEYKNSDRELKDLAYWYDVFKEEPHFSSLNPRPSPEYVEGKNYGKVQTFEQMAAISMPRLIPAELVKKVEKKSLELNLSPMLFYALALRTFLSYNSGSEDVCFATTGARRATVYKKKCGMTLAHMITWRTVIPETDPIMDALKKMDVAQKDMFKHISVDMADYTKEAFARFGTPEDAQYKTVVFTYQPYFAVENVDLKFTAEHVNVGFTPYPVYMNVMPRDGSKNLWADYIYGDGYFKRENIERFHRFMLAFVEKAVEDTDVTVAALRDACLAVT